MARLPRLYAPGVVQHVVQRPVEDRTLFVDADDYALFTRLLADAVHRHGLALHAFVLLPGEFRFLATPGGPAGIAQAMQAIGRRYVQHLNRKTSRAGPLWGSRYRSTLIDADRFLIASMHLLEQRPARVGAASAAAQWRWSSHAHHAGTEQLPFITDHAAYWALSDTPFERQAIYRRGVDVPVEPAIVERIERSVERGWVLGDARFVDALGAQVNRRPTPLQRGRPSMVSPISSRIGEDIEK